MKKAKKGHSRTRESADARRIAIEVLLHGESHEAAAQAAGVNVRTISRWLLNPAFAAELEKARTLAFADALNCLKGGSSFAVQTLLKNLGARSPAERRQTAREILTFAFKGVEVLGLEVRLEKVEELLEIRAGADFRRAGRVS